MTSESIQTWLKRKKTAGFVQNLLLGLVSFLAGVLITFLIFWFSYAVIWFGWFGVGAGYALLLSHKLHPLSHEARLVIAGVFVVLLYVQHFRTNPLYWGNYPRRDYAAGRLLARGSTLMGLGVMLAYPGASANMIADILLVAPRLVAAGWNFVAEGRRIRKLDENGCATLLTYLCSQPHVAPYDELRNAGWADWMESLREIEGVEFLEKGLILSGELKDELNKLN